MQTIQNKQENFLNGLHSLQLGQLSEYLVSPHEMAQALLKVEGKIAKSYPSYHLLHTELSFYYQKHLALYEYTNTHIYIHINVPMTTHTTQFSVYKIESFAVPFDTTRSQNNDGYTVIQNLHNCPFVNKTDSYNACSHFQGNIHPPILVQQHCITILQQLKVFVNSSYSRTNP